MTCDSHEWLDQHTIDDAVEEPPLKRDQIQKATHAVWSQRVEISSTSRRPFADRVFQPMQIVKDVRRAQKLQESKAGVTGEVDERDGIQADRYFHDDDTYLCQRCVGER